MTPEELLSLPNVPTHVPTIYDPKKERESLDSLKKILDICKKKDNIEKVKKSIGDDTERLVSERNLERNLQRLRNKYYKLNIY